MTPRRLNILALLALLIFLASQSITVVKDGERGIALRFGALVHARLTPGLYLHLPQLHEIRTFDGRRQVSDTGLAEYLLADKNRLLVEAYVTWQVTDPRRYFLRTGADKDKAEMLLMPRLKEALKRAFAGASLPQGMVGLPPRKLATLAAELNTTTARELGIQVLDVRVRRTAFPSAVEKMVYQRMRAEREGEAAHYRAEGQEKAAAIKLRVQREKTRILADAREQAERRRGEGDARAAAIAARAAAKDPEFYRFWRALQAYRSSFSKPGDVLMLKTDSEFLRYMKKPEQ